MQNAKLFTVFIAVVLLSSAFVFTSSSAASEQSGFAAWLSKAGSFLFGTGATSTAVTGYQVSADSSGGGGGGVAVPLKPSPCPAVGVGDVNSDGYVTYADVTAIQSCMLELSSCSLASADVNADKLIDSGDVIAIENYLAGAISTFPACPKSGADVAFAYLVHAPQDPVVGEKVSFSYTITNKGKATATGVSTGSGYNCSGGGGGGGSGAPGFTLAPGEGRFFSNTHTFSAPDTCTFTFSVSSDSDVDMSNNKASLTITAKAAPVVSEQVKCIFTGSTSEQKCYSDDSKFGCSGVESCLADVSGGKGTKLTWKSSCGGYTYTVIDGVNEYAKFECKTTPTPVCTDSDGGRDYYAKGTATGVNVFDKSHYDNPVSKEHVDRCYDEACTNGDCTNSGRLQEFYCNSEGIVDWDDYKCPNGCKDGACIKEVVSETITCIFSNSDKEQQCYVAGSFTDKDAGTKFCKGKSSCTIRYSGIKGEQVTWKSTCGSYQYTTQDGKNEEIKFECGKKSPCPEVGVGDVNSDGYVTSADITAVQSCILELSSCSLARADANGDKIIDGSDVIAIENYLAGAISTFPACSQTVCTDSDGGINLKVQGTASGPEWGTGNYVSKTDYCIADGEKKGRLAEFYCASNGQVSSITYGPENGCASCINGACLKQEEPVTVCPARIYFAFDKNSYAYGDSYSFKLMTYDSAGSLIGADLDATVEANGETEKSTVSTRPTGVYSDSGKINEGAGTYLFTLSSKPSCPNIVSAVQKIVITSGEEPTLDLSNYPYPFVKDGKLNAVIVVGSKAPSSDVIAAIDIATGIATGSAVTASGITPAENARIVSVTTAANAPSTTKTVEVGSAKLDTEIADPFAQNVITVGTPCINTVSSAWWSKAEPQSVTTQPVGADEPCSFGGLAEGTAMLKLISVRGKAGLLVSGTVSMDTRRAARVLADYKNWQSKGLQGTEVWVSGTSLTDITVYPPGGIPPLPEDKYVYDIRISKGWNLVSLLPLIAVTEDSEGKYASTTCSWMNGDSVSRVDYLKKNMFGYDSRNKKYVSLAELIIPSTPPDGYLVNTQYNSFWLRSSEDCSFTMDLSTADGSGDLFKVLDRISSNNYKLVNGWNFFAVWPEMERKTLDEVKGSCDITRAYGYNPYNRKWVDISSLYFGHDAVGNGFVMKVNGDCVLGDSSGSEEELPPPLPAGESEQVSEQVNV